MRSWAALRLLLVAIMLLRVASSSAMATEIPARTAVAGRNGDSHLGNTSLQLSGRFGCRQRFCVRPDGLVSHQEWVCPAVASSCCAMLPSHAILINDPRHNLPVRGDTVDAPRRSGAIKVDSQWLCRSLFSHPRCRMGDTDSDFRERLANRFLRQRVVSLERALSRVLVIAFDEVIAKPVSRLSFWLRTVTRATTSQEPRHRAPKSG